MPLSGPAVLLARMGIARMGTTRMGVLDLDEVGIYTPGADPGDPDPPEFPPERALWRKVLAPTTSWTRIT